MKNKFKVGDLVEYTWGKGHTPVDFKNVLGIVTYCGLDYIDTEKRRHRFINVHWSDGDDSSIWQGYGKGWEDTKVIVRNEN